MTKSETNLFKKGSKCHVCTGCGRCFGKKQVHTVCEFAYLTEQFSNEGSGTFLVAVDIGTTTIAMQLRETASGKAVETFSCINPQCSYGADVLSRIAAAGDKRIRAKMQSQVLGVLQEGVSRFTEKLSGSKGYIKGMAIAANTTMIHLLMGYEVEGLGQYPFTPYSVAEIRTGLFDVDTVILPCVSAFIGADVVAGVQALGMQEKEEVTLLIDLGTNGEIVLGNRERILATSTAAGPAFEGGETYFGTDLIKQVAALLVEGVVDETGLLQEPYFTEGVLAGGVRITQDYIRQLQMAKSAICTGIGILCKKYGLKSVKEVTQVYLAGGMGYYLDAEAARAIGLLPAVLKEKTVAVGNAALEGAFLYGRNVFLGGGNRKMVHQIEEFNLASQELFSTAYISGMDLKPCIE